ncbi:transcriptional regulator [Streptomyces sp. So13.3]|uniref:helix-turn-helix domain-containing protein n=1 Tax=Streptomyces TaxID=1883 RepID=UPI0011057AD0|nr:MULTISPECIES: helix-turn-helix domain-containing protein [Streptomyces]MCZ4102222.1 helix-turn-helix domain-containing protein [Streptomyces sp. H39-C1]MCZ4102956.1 helix-turn-helix domain-containing protein [Streptomyces sp. H39-C1]QNA77065.1 transcriptional regulator [Streptomyces sp. So13.3]
MAGKRLIGAAREKVTTQLATDYENGASIRTLATLTGHSYGFIHRVLVDAGVTLRSRGGPNNRSRPGQPTTL